MFVTLPMLLRTVGAVEYGIYSLATAAVGYFSIISFAARNSVVKYSAEFEQNRQDEVNAVFNNALGINAMLGLVVGGIVLVSGIYCEELFNIPAEYIGTAKFLLFIHAAAALVLQPLSVFGSLIYGMQQYGTIAVIDGVWAVTRTMTILAIYAFQGPITWLALEELGFQILKSIWLAAVARRRIPGLAFKPGAIGASQLMRIVRYGGWSMLYTISLILVYQGSMIMIGVLLSVALITHYQIAYKLYNAVNTVSLFINAAVLPASSSAIAAGDKAFIRTVIQRGTRINLIVLSVMALTFWVYAEPIIRIWLGPEYVADAVMPSRILLLSWLVSAASAVLIPVYWGQGKIAGLSLFAAAAALLQTASSAALGYWIGLEGVAWSNFAFFAAVGLYALRYVPNKFLPNGTGILKAAVVPGYGILVLFALVIGATAFVVPPPANLFQLSIHLIASMLTGLGICFASVARPEACLLWGFFKQRIGCFSVLRGSCR
jgi:O-antigen/teichoic acid export membrane protein